MAKADDSKKSLLKLERYCAWQERCQSEVVAKMEELGVEQAKQNKLLEYLQDEGYLDERRYAIQFAMGKFRLKKWGRIKIRHMLEAKDVPSKFIDIALDGLNKEDYHETLKDLLTDKRKSIADVADIYQLRHKVSVYAIGKGFEPELVWEILKGQP